MKAVQNTQVVVLPSKAVAEIRAMKGLHHKAKNGMFLFLGELMRLSHYAKGMIGTPVNLLANDIRLQHFNGSNHYREYLDILQTAGIIEIGESYQVGERTKCYNLTNEMLSSQFDALIIAHRYARPAESLRLDCKATGARLAKLNFNGSKAKSITVAYAGSESAWNNYRTLIGNEVENTFFPVIFIWNTKGRFFKVATNQTREGLLKYWGNDAFEIIKNNDSFYYMPLPEFQEMKRLSILWHYSYVTANWLEKRFFAYRDGVTFRKHSTITNTPKSLLKSCVTYKGEQLAEFDLGCSQFTLFARCIDISRPILLAADAAGARLNTVSLFAIERGGLHDESTKEFCRLAADGTLYNVIQERLSLKSRDAAKVAAMAAFYSNLTGEDKDTQGKAMIRQLFPEVVAFMDEYKETVIRAGGVPAELPKEMQRVESHLFIDEIAPELERAGLFFFTKHDSVLIAPEHLEQGKEIAKKYLNERIGGGKYILK